MAARSGDLINSLIEGGISPTAARLIANAIGNAKSPSFSRGNDTADVTPTEQLRLITSDDRRYTLTNLDYTPAKPFQDRIENAPNQYQGAPDDHPYKDAQPLRSAPPLSAPPVRSGKFINVEQSVESNSGVSTVSLNVRGDQGRHPRMDTAAGVVDLVNMAARSESPKFLSAEVQESDASTDLVVSLRNTQSATIMLANGDTRRVLILPEADAVGPANGAAGVNRPLESVTVTLGTGAPRELWAWPAAAAGAVPAWWTAASTAAATCRAFVVFNGSSVTTVNLEDLCSITSSQNVSKVVRLGTGRYVIHMPAQTVSNPNYLILGTPSRGAVDSTTLHVRHDQTLSETQFEIAVRDQSNNTINSNRVSVAVFA